MSDLATLENVWDTDPEALDSLAIVLGVGATRTINEKKYKLAVVYGREGLTPNALKQIQTPYLSQIVINPLNDGLGIKELLDLARQVAREHELDPEDSAAAGRPFKSTPAYNFHSFASIIETDLDIILNEWLDEHKASPENRRIHLQAPIFKKREHAFNYVRSKGRVSMTTAEIQQTRVTFKSPHAALINRLNDMADDKFPELLASKASARVFIQMPHGDHRNLMGINPEVTEPIEFLLDTGAESNTVSMAVIKRLGLEHLIDHSAVSYTRGVGGNSIIKKIPYLTVGLGDVSLAMPFDVIESDHNLLGFTTVLYYNMSINLGAYSRPAHLMIATETGLHEIPLKIRDH